MREADGATRFNYNALVEPLTDRRTDPQMRAIFVRAYEILEPFMGPDGSFLTLAHEYYAMQAMRKAFPELESARLFALLAYTCSVRASGRKPVA